MAEIKTKSRKNGTDKKQRAKKAPAAPLRKKPSEKLPVGAKKLQLVETAAGGRIGYSGGFSLVYRLLFWQLSPDIEQAVSRTRQPSTTVIAENGREIRSFGNVYSEVVYPLGTALLCQKRHYCHRRPAFLFPISVLTRLPSPARWLPTLSRGAMPRAAAPLPSKWRKTCF